MTREIDTFAEALLDGARFVPTIEDVELRPSTIQGQGMFATRARLRGEVLVILDGQVISADDFPRIVDALEWNALAPGRLLVRPIRTSYGYINHSVTPNVEIVPDGRTMRAARNIAVDDELTMDYFAQPVPASYLHSEEARVLRGKD